MNSCLRLLFLSTLFLEVSLGYAQGPAADGGFQKRANAFINKQFKRVPWEVSFNLAPILPNSLLGGESYAYMIKRNVGKGEKQGAWRFSISPFLSGKKEELHPDTTFKFFNKRTNLFRPRLEFGYEWQQVKGRFMLFYGLSSFYARETERLRSDDHFYPLGVPAPPRGKYEYKFQRNYFSISPLVGAKCRLNEHFSVSLESQLQTTYFWENSSTYFNNAFLQKDFVHDLSVLSYPIYGLNLTCHF